MIFQEGETYRVNHTRKGEFVLYVRSVSDEWIDGVLVSGNPKVMNPANAIFEGENITARRSFLTPLEHISTVTN